MKNLKIYVKFYKNIKILILVFENLVFGKIKIYLNFSKIIPYFPYAYKGMNDSSFPFSIKNKDK